MNRLAVPVHQAAETSPMVLGLDVTELLLAVLAVVVVIAAVGFGVVLLGRQRASKREHDLHRDLQEQRQDIERREHRLSEREDRLDADLRHLEDRVAELAAVDTDLETRRAELLDIEEERRLTLERLAGLTAEDARRQLVESIEADAKRTAAILARDIEKHAQEEADERAKRVLATVIQRLASEQTSESVVSIVHLPGDDMKGRIIGREGRNIRSFEQITGVNLIIDDTPEAVLLSCFDPVRREMARLTLEELVADGRIHPTRIEEVHERSCLEVQRLCVRAGEDAAFEMGITDLHPELVATLGKLKYRTSYGQNVLKHLVESGHAAGLLADELGLDRTTCVRGAFLHDIGKALTHEVEGSHAIVGAELARTHGESEDIVHAIEAHHNEVEPRTVEAVITQAADAISGGRPGARRESLEAYVERLHRLEEIALGKPGVEKVFAMQAGRDVRVMVLPDVVDDIAAQVLARDIAKQFEEELTYPGQIKVTVIRESRATEVAR
ncbi:ribonuclease Y [Nocardioides sp. WL0053]|uniref:Ribonuclease Y n=1 Tax=Nocardioides jiangsuensis TaxID=2866161 RepID=A0ABS7RLK9_9ACTN|nr:ribonuclease Y [Nocardioides jiangsuensis]MBY9075891.1 ribonuclease Y [Nocardioides jiangsuensis]